MKKVVTAEQMGEIDRLTTSEFGVASIDLMENAATAVRDVILDEFRGSVADKKSVVLCGTGNNGGDGAAIARLLMQNGADVVPLLLGKIENTKGDARRNFQKLRDECGFEPSMLEVSSIQEIEAFWKKIRSSARSVDLIVDAVFGTGLHRPVTGVHEYFLSSAMDYSHEMSPRPLLVSVDLPSGIDSDSPQRIGFNFKPDLTVAFTSPKLANVLPPAKAEQGRLYIKQIGSPEELIERAASRTFVTEKQDAVDWMSGTGFSSDSYKNRRGSALVAAGSKKYSGAAVLAANGAMRSGAGIVTATVPKSAFSAVSERVLPEVMVREVPETESGSFSVDSYDEIGDLVKHSDAALVGCGVSRDPGTKLFVERFVSARVQPTVIDADGLNVLSPLELTGSHESPLILTPHIGEFERLTDRNLEPGAVARIDAIREIAVNNNVICVLKGESTLTASPNGSVFINPTGNPGLGKAGNGDNLAGIIAGFVAQTISTRKTLTGNNLIDEVFTAVISAVYIAGLAGDIAAKQFGKRVMTASDVRDSLAEAFASVTK